MDQTRQEVNLSPADADHWQAQPDYQFKAETMSPDYKDEEPLVPGLDRVKRDNTQFVFDAYDCSNPVSIEDVGHAITTNCVSEVKTGTTTVNASYQLLQVERTREAKGYSCSVAMTQTNSYCGVYDHQTAVNRDEVYNVPFYVSPAECRVMQTTKKYIDPQKKVHELIEGATTPIQYFHKGRSWIASNGEGKCTGEQYFFNDAPQESAVVSIHMSITLLQENYMYSKEQIVAQTANVRLPCPPHQGECHTLTATYVWSANSMREDCDLSVARPVVSGYDATSPLGDTVFMSTDESLVRVIKKHSESRCGRVVYSTEYPELFLYPLSSPHQFTKKIEPQTMSTVTFVKNRDSFLYHHLADTVLEEFNRVMNHDCQRQQTISRMSFWMQHKDPGATTWLIGNGIFGTSAGEVIYQYQCAHLLVRGRETVGCYQAMPVQLTTELREAEKARQIALSQDLKRKISLGMGADGPIPSHLEPTLNYDEPLFLEPLTRRLTHIGIPTPCARHFASKYKNTHGGWVSSSEQIQTTTAPKLPSDDDERKSALRADKRPNVANGGIYDKASLDAMEEYQDFSRTQAGIAATLVRQTIHSNGYRPGGPIRAGDMFGDYPDPNPFTGIWAALMKFLKEFGEVSSVLISLYIIVRLALKVIEWGYSLFVLRDIHGCSKALCWIPFISMFLIKAYKKSDFASEERLRRHKKQIDRVAKKVARRGYAHVTPTDYLVINPEAKPLETSGGQAGAPMITPRPEAPSYNPDFADLPYEEDPLPEPPREIDGSRTLTGSELKDAFKEIHQATRIEDSRSPKISHPMSSTIPGTYPTSSMMPPAMPLMEWVTLSSGKQIRVNSSPSMSSFQRDPSSALPRTAAALPNDYESPNQMQHGSRVYPGLKETI